MNNLSSVYIGYSFVCLFAIIFYSALGVHQSDLYPSLIIINFLLFACVVFLSMERRSIAASVGVVYLLLTVFIIHILYKEYAPSIFGFNSIDSTYYFEEIASLGNQSVYDKWVEIARYNSLPDLGFLFFLALISFDIALYPELLIISGVLIHAATSILIYRSLRKVFPQDVKLSNSITVLYFLNPAAALYINSGLKEPLFAFLIALFVYGAICYKLTGSKYSLICLLALSLISGLFRLYYPPLLIFSLTILVLEKSGLLSKFVLAGVGLFGVGIFISLFSDEIQRVMSLDLSLVRQERISGDGLLEFAALSYSSLFGPFPKLSFFANEKTLFYAADFMKMFISIFSILGIYRSIQKKSYFFASLAIILLANSAITVLIAISFDYRFFYPMLPIIFVIARYGLEGGNIGIKFWSFCLTSFLFMILYNSK